MSKKWKISLVAIALSVSSFAWFSFSDDYFEVSRNLDIFTSLYRELNVYYVDETKPGSLMKTGIDAMLKSLDPYTNYIPESDIEDYRFMTTGQYGGIGALIAKKGDQIVITDPYENYPAQKAGLLAGDVVLEVDGKELNGKNSDDVSKALKGQPGTSVRLTIKRDGTLKPFEKTLLREEIKIPAVSYSGVMGDGSVGYIRLTSFTENCGQEVKDAFVKLKTENNIKSLVLDLRENPGGLLNEAVNIVNLFVPKGTMVVKTHGKNKEWDKEYKALNNPVDTEMPLAVLINSGSASASEIVAGCIQDLDRGILIGQRSFGKGLVQTTRPISYNAQLKVTTAKY
ncbi:MAG TPA: S41 family peptidase, partial [Bacteroidia bacterium]|nr:S41 family peptidase [Bacteroidia bacterium]